MKKETTRSAEARAKINLFLAVTGKRADGYHELDSVMQSVSLSDTVTVTAEEPNGRREITLVCSHPDVPTDGRNIAVKCAERFFEETECLEYAVRIRIEKRIPISGGLAGGSTDGAAVLKLLNELYEANLSLAELCEIGGKVGADIPFCLIGGTALCRGIGDVITPLPIPVPRYTVLIVSPGGGVSTPEAYRMIDDLPPSPPLSSDAIVGELTRGEIPLSLSNDFERVILPLNENARRVRTLLRELGASSAMMSGSGPTVFGLFDTAENAAKAARILQNEGFFVQIASPSFT